MSNFSDPPLAQLLEAMASEWGVIAADLDRLGGCLSAACAESAPQELQHFDILQQRAQGQANLLRRVCEKLSADERFDRHRITEMLEAIPFHHIRASMQSGWEGAPAPAGDGLIDWF